MVLFGLLGGQQASSKAEGTSDGDRSFEDARSTSSSPHKQCERLRG